MFEASLIESRHNRASQNQRWTAALSLTLQCSLAAALLVIPLLHLETLAFHPEAPKIALLIKPAVLPRPKIAPTQPAPASMTLSDPGRSFTAPTQIPHFSLDSLDTGPIPAVSGPVAWGSGSENMLGAAIANAPTVRRITVAAAAPAHPLVISSGVSQGLLLAPIRPVYPRIAIATRTEGTVVVDAVISKSGTIESVRASSGPEILRPAAIEAIRNARYSPYLLNGLPTEVETTITVTFRLAGSS